MERNDFWTHLALMIGTLVLLILPAWLTKGFASTMVVYFVGTIAVIAVAAWSRWQATKEPTKGE